MNHKMSFEELEERAKRALEDIEVRIKSLEMERDRWRNTLAGIPVWKDVFSCQYKDKQEQTK